MEDIKETHPDTYELLSGQNIHSLVVVQFRYKDEIKGFFGVDNPPDTDSIGLALFLDMMSTLIISMIKIRDTHNTKNVRQDLWDILLLRRFTFLFITSMFRHIYMR